jgi:Inositol-pentakisphosphate 2-kinase
VHSTTDTVNAGLGVCPQKQMCVDPDGCQWMMQWHSKTSMLAAHAEYEHHHRYRDTVQALHSMSWGEVQEVLRKYLLSVAAKDCSIIVSYTVAESAGEDASDVLQTPVMDCHACVNDADKLRDMLHSWKKQAGTDHRVEGPCHCCVGSMRMGQQLVRYRLGVVDMDRKRISKVEHHHELDREILQVWNALK